MPIQVIDSVIIAILVIIGILLGASLFLWFQSKKKKKPEFSDRVMIFAIMICTIAPFVTYVIILYAKYFFSKYLFVIGSENDWITLVGSLFGGFITLTAVIFTKYSTKEESDEQIRLLNEHINEVKTQNKIMTSQFASEKEMFNKELALKSIPLLFISVNDKSSKNINSTFISKSLDGEEKEQTVFFQFTITNRSINFATKIECLKFEIYQSDEFMTEFDMNGSDLICENKDRINLKLGDVGVIPGGYSETFVTSFKLDFKHDFIIRIDSDFKYYDYLGINDHIVHTITSVKFFLKEEYPPLTDVPYKFFTIKNLLTESKNSFVK